LRATGHNDILGVLEATRAGTIGAAILWAWGIGIFVLLLACCGVPIYLWCMPTRSRKAKGTQLEMGKVPKTEAPDTGVNP
jgi:hypothetical protein